MNFRLSFLLILMFGLYGVSKAQSDHKWSKFIAVTSNQKQVPASGFYLVDLKSDTKLANLQKEGVNVVRRLDSQTCIIQPSNTPTTKWRSLVNATYSANNEWKMNARIKQGFIEKELVVKVSGINQFVKRLQDVKSEIIIKSVYEPSQIVFVELTNSSLVHKLKTWDCVLFIDSKHQERPVAESNVRGMDLTVNQIPKLKSEVPSLTGEGMLVSVNEQFYDTTDWDLLGKHQDSGFEPETTDLHATDMATIIAGAGNRSMSGLGVAPKAKLSSTDNVTRLPDLSSYYQNEGIYTQNHSWGERAIENFYGAIAEAYDISTNENDELLHVFSVGNRGLDVSEEGTYADISGFANLSGEYKMAKNILTVGAVDWELAPLNAVSRGPAYDGRVKPEVCAFNTEGSSGAAATVSGIVTLLQQAYKNKNGGALPKAALLKAILINTADDAAGAEGLDFVTGYGNVDAWKAYEALNNENYFSDDISQGEDLQFQLDVPDNAKNLKVTLVWHDMAASPNASIALINDLDLELTKPNAEILLPWVLNSSPHIDSLSQSAKRKADHLNNIEQVTLETPTAGQYTITVKGFDISSTSQPFFIAYTWETENNFEWTFPTLSDNMPYLGEGNAVSSNASYFRWDASYPLGTIGTLEYSVDNGTTWLEIATNIDISAGQYYWEAPDTTTLALARMTINTDEYPTEEFVLSREFFVSVGFDCEDSAQLNWKYQAAIDHYRVLYLGDESLEELRVTTDTFTILDLVQSSKTIYSIEPVFANGKTAIKSPAFDYRALGAGCYLSSFFAILAEDGNSVLLSLTLGTYYGVAQVEFQRLIDGEYQTIATETDFEGFPLEISDIPTIPGLQYYRVIVSFDNGGVLDSDPVSIYFLSDDLPVMVFPNPAKLGDGVNVFTKPLSGQDTFELIDLNGKVLMKKSLLTDRDFLFTDGVEAGMYIYRITVGGQVTIGRLVVQ